MYITEARIPFWVIGQPDDEIRKYYEVWPPWQVADKTWLTGWICRSSKNCRNHLGSGFKLRARNARLWQERQDHPRIICDKTDIRMTYFYHAYSDAGLPDKGWFRFVSDEPYKSIVDNYFILTELDALQYEQETGPPWQPEATRKIERDRIKTAASQLADQLRAAYQEMLLLDELNPLVRQAG
jgi:hypothetical protein